MLRFGPSVLGCSHVVGVSAHFIGPRVPHKFLAPRAFSVFVLFQHQYTGAFAHHETVPILIPRTAGGCRVVVTGQQRLGRRKPPIAKSDIVDSAPRQSSRRHRRIQ